MKAITIWQPYATLLARKIKRYETRSWQTGYRGAIAIHAAKKSIKAVEADIGRSQINTMQGQLFEALEDLPLGAVIAVGQLIACHAIDRHFMAKLTETERRLGNFEPGRYAWEFEDIVMLDEPEPAAGKQGLWEWEP